MSNRNSRHPWGRSWRAEMGQYAKPRTRRNAVPVETPEERQARLDAYVAEVRARLEARRAKKLAAKQA